MLSIIMVTVALNGLTQLLSEGTISRPLFTHAALMPRPEEDFNVALFRIGTASMEATSVAGLGNEVGGVIERCVWMCLGGVSWSGLPVSFVFAIQWRECCSRECEFYEARNERGIDERGGVVLTEEATNESEADEGRKSRVKDGKDSKYSKRNTKVRNYICC